MMNRLYRLNSLLLYLLGMGNCHPEPEAVLCNKKAQNALGLATIYLIAIRYTVQVFLNN